LRRRSLQEFWQEPVLGLTILDTGPHGLDLETTGKRKRKFGVITYEIYDRRQRQSFFLDVHGQIRGLEVRPERLSEDASRLSLLAEEISEAQVL